VSDRILVVDSEPESVAAVTYALALEGFNLSTATTGLEAQRAIAEERPALVILDLVLPDVSGAEILRNVRSNDATRDIGVIVLTGERGETERIAALSSGADDYVTKPFSSRELVLRVRNVLKRLEGRNGKPKPISVVGTLIIDRSEPRVRVGSAEVKLTPTEYRLLVALAEHVGRVKTRAELLRNVWDLGPETQTRTVDIHVRRLRAKLGSAGHLIESVRGFGYRLRSA
jgi:two-component system, OmpR family, phosphate regulon response regulator PhoB